MAEVMLEVQGLPKAQAYAAAEAQIGAILDGIDDPITAMATIACVLHHGFGHLWTGFYRAVSPSLLRVGPYQGTLGCLEIALPRGVCGTAAAERRTVVVPDVEAFPGHIACDGRSRSEIVVPVLDPAGALLAVLDVDSDRLGAFDDEDARGLLRIVGWFAGHPLGRLGRFAASEVRMSRVAQHRSALSLALLGVALGCAAPAARDPHAPAPAPEAKAPAAHSDVDDDLAQVARIHGGAGPWVVAGYRMGRHALARLGLGRQSFDLEVVHRSPRAVQFSCVADGAAAATGASLGKLNLSLVETDEASLATVYRRKSTGAVIALRPTAAFRARFLDVPIPELAAAGRTVMTLPDSAIFEEVAPPTP